MMSRGFSLRGWPESAQSFPNVHSGYSVSLSVVGISELGRVLLSLDAGGPWLL